MSLTSPCAGRVTSNRSSRLSEVIRNKPLSCLFVSGEARSCPFASAASRRLKRRGEARRRSFGLSRPLQAILCSFGLQAVRRRGGSRGEAVSQTRRGFVVARKRKRNIASSKDFKFRWKRKFPTLVLDFPYVGNRNFLCRTSPPLPRQTDGGCPCHCLLTRYDCLFARFRQLWR